MSKLTNVQDLKVQLFNVGQGDHIMLELPNGEFGIIDFFYRKTDEPLALTYLKYLQRTRRKKPVISFISVTHPDTDHTLGIKPVLDWVLEHDILVKNFWAFPGMDFNKLMALYEKAYDELDVDEQVAARKKNIQEQLLNMRNFIERRKGKCKADYIQGIQLVQENIGGEIQVFSLAPLGEHVDHFNQQSAGAFIGQLKWVLRGRKSPAHANLVSSILKMRFRKHNLIFGGDAGAEVWQDVLAKVPRRGANERFVGPLPADFIKISHHGSKHSSSPELWKSILGKKKCYIGISAGRGYGHPHRETIDDIKQAIVRGQRAHVLATNECRKCLNESLLKPQDVRWGEAVEVRPERVEAGLRLVRSPRYQKLEENRASARMPAFVGYTFTFSGGSKRIRAARMVAKGKDQTENCIYGGKREELFPECA